MPDSQYSYLGPKDPCLSPRSSFGVTNRSWGTFLVILTLTVCFLTLRLPDTPTLQGPPPPFTDFISEGLHTDILRDSLRQSRTVSKKSSQQLRYGDNERGNKPYGPTQYTVGEKLFSTLRSNPDQSSTQPTPSHTCSPIQKVGFAKTHKTASSTVQNILMRFVLHSQWNFVMYNAGSHLGPPRNQYRLDTPFQASWVHNTDWRGMVEEQGYNVMALHTMWDQHQVEKVLGNGSDVRYITILRNPVDQFESMYNYVHFEETFHMDLETFINVYVKPGLKVDRINGYLGRNQQLWDLGLTNTEDPAVVEEKVQELDRDFDLVMIAEELEESLVVLSNELCWPLVNMTSLKLNTRKPSTVSSLSPESRSLLQSWLWADYTLYTYFKDKLHRKKLELGVERMGSQVETLRQLNTQMEEECVIQVVNDTKSLAEEFQPWSKDVLGFRINEKRKDCAYFGMAEISFIDTLRDKQRERLTLWKLVPSWVSRLVPWVTEG